MTYFFGNHFKVANPKKHLTTNDNGVGIILKQECILRPNDESPILTKLEYIGWVEKNFELNYGVLKIVVLFCNWVKTNHIGNNAIVKRNEYKFTLVNFTSLIPISDQSLVFPLHVDQVFFLVTLRKENRK